MNKAIMGAAWLAAALALHVTSSAAVTILDPAYSASTYHAHSDPAESVVSFDWDASDAVYYQTSTAFYNFGGLFRWDGVSETGLVGGGSDFSGASTLRIGDYVYFNTSDFTDQKVFKYGPLSGMGSSSLVSTAVNFGFYRRGPGEIFITGAIGFGTNQIFYTTLDGAGNFTAPPFSLGLTVGGSGPIAFDGAGNLFYAPGFGDLKIYRYTAADVAAALADPIMNPLPAAATRLWRDYSGDFATVSGGTGMAFDGDGALLVTFSDFVNPSLLVRFDVGIGGAYAGHSAILSSTGRLGDVRFKGGSIYVADDNTILQVVPEPGTAGLVLAGLAAWVYRRRRAGAR